MKLEDMNLIDGRNFVDHVPHEWFAQMRKESPVYWHPQETAPRGGFWSVTDYDDCVTINRDWEHFASSPKTSLFADMDEDLMAQQRLMMLNMEPPMHTRYRRLVNKGFTPKMVRDLDDKMVVYADRIIDAVCEKGSCDFVEDIAAELPLFLIAEILGIPEEDRHRVFDWSNQMIGSDDPEYQVSAEASTDAAMQVYAFADELTAKKSITPTTDILSALISAEVDGEKLDQMEIDLFFLLLIVAGNETTRNLISGAMHTFFQFPDQWQKLVADPTLLPNAVEEMLRFVTPVMHFRRTATMDWNIGDQAVKEGDKVVFWHTSANRDASIFERADEFDITRNPNPHIAFGGGGPHFCLGANLARMEISVMFSRLLERMPDLQLDGAPQRLQSNFINGTKHLPIAFAPSAPLGA